METRCTKKGCYFPESGCISVARDHAKCKYWKAANKGAQTKKQATKELVVLEGIRIPWTSSAYGMDDVFLTAGAANTNIIGLVGASKAGKTTYLGLLFHMLLAGEKIGDWKFSHSYTLQGWRNISAPLEWSDGSKYSFPPHTSINAGRVQGLLHLAFKKGDKLRDFLFTDVSGEWFTEWASDKNSTAGEGAKWIHQHADAFLFFLDCDKLKDKKTIGEGRREIYSIADRLKNELADRPVAALWAKADLKKEIFPKLVNRITAELQHKIDAAIPFFEVSHMPISDKDTSHQANILAVILWLEAQLSCKERSPIVLNLPQTEVDFFFYCKAQ